MSWGAKIKAALHGDVDSADVAALLASTRALTALREDLAGRRLDVELAHGKDATAASAAGEAWRVADELGQVTGPLWLAEGLVALAQSIYDAEAQAHPDAPGTMSAVAHNRAVALLQPVASIITE